MGRRTSRTVMNRVPKLSMFRNLCFSCDFRRDIFTPKGSRFLLCERSLSESSYPKYPPQPVFRCAGYTSVRQENACPEPPQSVG